MATRNYPKRARQPNDGNTDLSIAPPDAVAAPTVGVPSPPSATGGAPKLPTTGAPRMPRTSFGTEITGMAPKPAEALPPWMRQPAIPQTRMVNVAPPQWKVRDVIDNNAAFVQDMKQRLWQRYNEETPERRASVFWQGVKQNPEYVAGALARRIAANATALQQNLEAGVAPKLDETLQRTMDQSENLRWLNWINGLGPRPNG